MGEEEKPTDLLGDFFAKKAKKKIKGSNLNVASSAAKPEAKKPGKKDAEEEGWEDDADATQQPMMKVEAAGKLMREEDKKEDDDKGAQAWGSVKVSKLDSGFDKKYPTLAKSVGASSNINIDDGSEPKINIQTSKNVFSALGNDDDDEEEKRPKEIKPAMVNKKKGESEKVAIQREVDKYATKKGSSSSSRRDKKDDDDDESDEAEEEEQVVAPVAEAKKKKKDKKDEAEAKEQEQEAEVEEDLKIQFDLVASKAKYEGRRKLPPKAIPQEELREEKENRPKPTKKKWANVDDDDLFREKQLPTADW
mmetsp:Transcript_63229/g.137518  ORF Transcript_63229/g.137518 Transcript_63229/m.137518 type:complete len:307 (-) Transcript_63229:108-1028(-)|eukprot:CAMPEP_0170619656 /NCGR_PEP_ID=MMETSP0224-20130122/27632_1 /TAXON_ID=285029 /ORGANISM="Togula jolla, Strain CCCM 725" /LENGTH=306 /DNA_ID=CAMNT_0010945759 /DNA_START=80 /DNA_END=1000 /DNA_ORIENTATION=+